MTTTRCGSTGSRPPMASGSLSERLGQVQGTVRRGRDRHLAGAGGEPVPATARRLSPSLHDGAPPRATSARDRPLKAACRADRGRGAADWRAAAGTGAAETRSCAPRADRRAGLAHWRLTNVAVLGSGRAWSGPCVACCSALRGGALVELGGDPAGGDPPAHSAATDFPVGDGWATVRSLPP